MGSKKIAYLFFDGIYAFKKKKSKMVDEATTGKSVVSFDVAPKAMWVRTGWWWRQQGSQRIIAGR